MEEQQELERLRYQSMVDKSACWYWNRETYRFEVNEHWRSLTGYEPKDWFPQNLSRGVPIESLLDNLIDQWVHIVAEEDRQSVKIAFTRFLLFDSSDNYFEKAHRITCADGTRKCVLTTARSVWKTDGNIALLMHLVVQSKDISADISTLSKPMEQAVAITQNKVELAEQGKAIAGSQEHIEAIERKAKNLETVLKAVLAVIPLFSALAIALGGAFQEFTKAVKIDWSLWRNPPEVLSAPVENDGEFGLNTINDQTIDQIADLMKRATPLGDRVKLSAYNPGRAPTQYRLLLAAQQGDSELSQYYSSPIYISSSTFTSNRARDHIASRPVVFTEGDLFQYTVPFRVVRRSGREQTFFVGIDARNVDEDQSAEIQATTRKLAANIKSVLEESFKSNIN